MLDGDQGEDFGKALPELDETELDEIEPTIPDEDLEVGGYDPYDDSGDE